jgi:hypothetical protein
MKKIRHVALLMVFVLIGFLLCAEGAVSSGKRYTVIVYLAADNDLGGGTPSDFDFMDFDEMEKALVTSGANADIVVLWDRPGTNDTAIYWVQADPLQGTLATYTQDVNMWYVPPGWAFTYPGGYPQGAGSPSEENMGNGATLTAFLDWCYLNFDSDYYALILWNHGWGWEPKAIQDSSIMREFTLENGQTLTGSVWPQSEPVGKSVSKGAAEEKESDVLRGACVDDTDGGDYLTTKEVATGIATSSRGNVENLGFDACYMQMLEVAYEVRNVADYMTGSQEAEWGYGWAYQDILDGITATTTPLELAQVWGATRSSSRWISGGLDTISSLDLAQVGALASAVSDLADRLSTLLATESEYEKILLAKILALRFFPFDRDEFVDLDIICWVLGGWVDDATAKSLAQAVQTQITNTVVAMDTPYWWVGGVSIYLPLDHDRFWQDYYGTATHADYNGTNFAFCADHTWDEFLNSFLATDYADLYEPNDMPSQAYTLWLNPGYTLYFPQPDFDDSTEDWYKIEPMYPCEIEITTWCTEYSSDTVIYLYDSLENAEIDDYFDWDDNGLIAVRGYNQLGSYLYLPELPGGAYYLKVVQYGGFYGPNRDYVLSIGRWRVDTDAVFRVERWQGDVFADQNIYGQGIATGQADVAEWVPVSEPVEAGDVLELDPLNPGFYRKARAACSTLVAGVVSSDPGVMLGTDPVQGSTLEKPDGEQALLALIGIVPVKVTDAGGPIAVGDLLVASSEPGYARRWVEEDGPNCGYVGKALELLESGTGVIQVLLMR